MQWQNQCVVADFIIRLGAYYLLSDMPKNIKIEQQLPKLQQMHTILTRSFTCRIRVYLQGSAANNLDDVANLIPRLCTETS